MVAVGTSAAGLLVARSSKKNLETKVRATVDAPIATAFHYIAPVDLTHIFRGTALISAIAETSIKEAWHTPGLVRTITFADGTTSQESLLTVVAPTSFSYKNEHFTSPVLRRLLRRLEGEWRFTELRNGQTKIDWTYRAIPLNGLSCVLVQLVLMPQIHSMLTNALAILKEDLEMTRNPAVEASVKRAADYTPSLRWLP